MLEKLIFVYHVYPAASGIPWQALPAFWQGADPSWVGPRLTAALTILRYQVGSDILSSLSGIGYRRVTLAAAKATDNITHMTICETIGNIAFKSWNISGLLS